MFIFWNGKAIDLDPSVTQIGHVINMDSGTWKGRTTMCIGNICIYVHGGAMYICIVHKYTSNHHTAKMAYIPVFSLVDHKL